ncbi:hypothetical protein AVEN_225581-1 [Araneus ventricosus]|uniref:Uncharacterized protein n=1 Tax=Araneus ventricosus TaxID=182803 RepID=A0A4Y2MNS6_ARAVE|nr:hypothetical protein AVEN_225581-1 [Araneus ventricosus]
MTSFTGDAVFSRFQHTVRFSCKRLRGLFWYPRLGWVPHVNNGTQPNSQLNQYRIDPLHDICPTPTLIKTGVCAPRRWTSSLICTIDTSPYLSCWRSFKHRDANRHSVLEQSTIVTLEGSDWTRESDVTLLHIASTVRHAYLV